MRANLASELQTLLDAETAMLETWLATQISNAETLANDRQIRQTVYQLLDGDGAHAQPQVPETSIHAELQKKLPPSMSSHDYVGYLLADKSKRIFSSSHTALTGQQEVAEYDAFLTRALDGETNVCPPFPSVVIVKNEFGDVRVGEPTMFVAAPIRDMDFQVVAALALQIRPEREFTRILQLHGSANRVRRTPLTRPD